MTICRRSLFAAIVVLLLAGVTLGVMASLGTLPGVSAAPPLQRGGSNPCSCVITKTLQPDTILDCEQSEVTVGVWPECPGTPVNIVIIVDEVYKPNFSNPKDRTQALRNAVQRQQLDEHPNVRIAVVWMKGGSAVKKVDLTNDSQRIISRLDIPVVSRFDAEVQCFECGFREAVRIFDRAKDDMPDVDSHEITLLAPLGVYTAQAGPGILRGATWVKGRGATSITTCFAWTHCDQRLRTAATNPRLYLAYGEGNRLAAVMLDVVRDSVETFLRRVTLVDYYPDTVEVVTDSVAPVAEMDLVDRTLTWSFDQPIGEAYTVTYRVKPQVLGSLPLGENSNVVLVDSHSREATQDVPVPVLNVPARCPEEPTETPIPTPTLTPTPIPTPTGTPVPPTPTSEPKPVFLPVAIREQCVPAWIFTDVALVLDVSTSMRAATSDGRTKLAAVQAAARAFLDLVNLAPSGAAGHDRVAIVGFNRGAWIQQALTNDRAVLLQAIDDLPAGMHEFTRLDLAFKRGAQSLELESRGPNTPVMIVLTDGMPNQVPYAEDGTMETTVLREASIAKEAGVTIYTIGVGRAEGSSPEINPDLLKAAATRPQMYFGAPDAEQLTAIYAELLNEIPCGGAVYWPNGASGP